MSCICLDHLHRLVESTYETMTKKHSSDDLRYKVLAGIVMTREQSNGGAVVVGVTSGSKCINGGSLSMEGETLNDCHAEILARRCLLAFLYDQLENYRESADNCIFQLNHNTTRLSLKDNILFHLYISSSPCGDARIFTLTEKSLGSDHDPHPFRVGRGVLRTKIECGEGMRHLGCYN